MVCLSEQVPGPSIDRSRGSVTRRVQRVRRSDGQKQTALYGFTRRAVTGRQTATRHRLYQTHTYNPPPPADSSHCRPAVTVTGRQQTAGSSYCRPAVTVTGRQQLLQAGCESQNQAADAERGS